MKAKDNLEWGLHMNCALPNCDRKVTSVATVCAECTHAIRDRIAEEMRAERLKEMQIES